MMHCTSELQLVGCGRPFYNNFKSKQPRKTMSAIDHHSQIPYYVQVKQVIRERIHSGVWQPNEQIPSEAELCDLFEVSRTVIRQALQDLMHEGLIVRRKGKGSFVAPAKISERLVQKLTGFYHDMVDQGYKPITRVLALRVLPCTRQVADHLMTEQGSPVIEIVRLRSVEGLPMVLVTSYIPNALCSDLVNEDLSDQSLYDVLEQKYGIYIAYGRRVIQAVSAPEDVAALLEVNKGTPLFLLDSISYQADGTPVEYYSAYHRGDRTQFEVELIRVREPGAPTPLPDLPPSNRVATD
jgi:GntR family transcriptional regulator